LAFVVVCVGIMMLRVTAPGVRRQFRTPWVWFVAPAGVVSCGLMMVSLSNATWVRLVLWTILGLVIYFAYGRRHAAPSKWKVQ
jgi:APA family basic amino acid/polyamine antiporter